MKAAQINSYGGKDVMQTITNADKPTAGSGQVLVGVHAAAVNPFDWKVREGYMKNMIHLQFPATLGGDVAGVVAEVGEGVDGFTVGQEVYGQANSVSGQGSFAEFTLVAAEALTTKPASLDFAQVAAVPLAASSAYQALVDTANLRSGQKVLIHGGAGGIGSFAIQLAKHLGAYVATTVSTDDSALAHDLGADEVIDYKSQNFETVLAGYDVVLDTVGGETATKSYPVLKAGGQLISMVAPPDEALIKQFGVTALTQSSRVTTKRLQTIAELIDQGVLKVQVDKMFPLDEAAEALDYLKTGKHRGKVVIKIKD